MCHWPRKPCDACSYTAVTSSEIPPEIGEMENLDEFLPYTSQRLHWFPYEITRCTALVDSCVSTRALYGNFKYRPPFPELEAPVSSTSGLDLDHLPPERYGATAITACSVCRIPLSTTGLHQVWISVLVATDVLPLLVNACSSACIAKLPPGARNHLPGPHQGRPVGTTAASPSRLNGCHAAWT